MQKLQVRPCLHFFSYNINGNEMYQTFGLKLFDETTYYSLDEINEL